jgi:hypothetical protein
MTICLIQIMTRQALIGIDIKQVLSHIVHYFNYYLLELLHTEKSGAQVTEEPCISGKRTYCTIQHTLFRAMHRNLAKRRAWLGTGRTCPRRNVCSDRRSGSGPCPSWPPHYNTRYLFIAPDSCLFSCLLGQIFLHALPCLMQDRHIVDLLPYNLV